MRRFLRHTGGIKRFGTEGVLLGLSGLLLSAVIDQSTADGAPGKVTPAAAIGDRDPLAIGLEKRLADDVRPLLQKYCYQCHGNGKKKGGVKLDGPGDIKAIMNMADHWLTVVEVMNARLMPPEKKPQPSAHELQTIQQWVEEATEYYPADAEPDPGWYTIHRMNKSEYRNTLRDLLDIDPAEHDLAAQLPNDDTGYGFDNIADVLSVSPLQVEKYLSAAEQAVELALDPRDPAQAHSVRNLKRSNVGEDLDGGGHAIWANGTISGDYTFPQDGEYEILARVYGSPAGGKGPEIAFTIGEEKLLDGFAINAIEDTKPQLVKVNATIAKGSRSIAVHFINDDMINGEDRNLWVESIKVIGPIQPADVGGIYDEVFFIKPTADDKGNRLPDAQGRKRITESQAARKVIERFATRAFRRQANAGEVAALLRVYRGAREEGDDYESAVRLALTASLVSPNFLYRPIANPKPNDAQYIYELSDDEIASRLSYFLWSSTPDDRLLALARQKKLSEPAVLQQQVRRMLMDPRSDALVENFAGQWLLLRKLESLEMDPKHYPGFNQTLSDAMRSEAELFFADVLRENHTVLAFLDSDYTYLNETLAKHYGIPGVRGANFRRIDLPEDSPRGGVLTMAATLTVTSHPTRTSPVKRGEYVLSQLMGTAPPPPPPDIPPLELATEKLGDDATLREQLAAHVEDPSCAVCHRRLDPIGLAMENFTAIGAWRDTELGRPIDATGELPGGITFNGPAELKRVMLDQQDQFVQNFSRKMLTYAIGRGTEPFDRPTIKQIAQAAQDDGYRIQSLIEAIVLSDAFRKARGRESKP